MLVRRILFLPVLRFVDDYFAAEREDVVKHSLGIFARYTYIFHISFVLDSACCSGSCQVGKSSARRRCHCE